MVSHIDVFAVSSTASGWCPRKTGVQVNPVLHNSIQKRKKKTHLRHTELYCYIDYFSGN